MLPTYDRLARLEPFKDLVKENPQWQHANYIHAVKHHNTTEKVKGSPRTPSDLDYLEVPRCLLWGTKQFSELDARAKKGNQQLETWSAAIAQGVLPQQEQPFSATSTVLKRVSEALAPILNEHLAAASSSASAAPPPSSAEDLLLTLNANDVDQALREDPHAAVKGLEDIHDVDLLSDETKTAILKKIVDRAKNQSILMEEAAERRKSRATSEERQVLRKSPFLERQELPCAIRELYSEKKMELQDWGADESTPFNPGWVQKEPVRSTIVELLDKLHALPLAVDWEVRQETTDGKTVRHYMPKVKPHFLAHHWLVMTTMQRGNPFEIKLEFPPEIGYGMAVMPHLVWKPLVTTADAFGKFPKAGDTMLVRCSEMEQCVRMTSAAAAMNNVVAVANRLLSLSIEDISTPLAEERRTERLLTSLVREGATLVNQLTTRVHVLTISLLRRDAMLRGGIDPTSHSNLFASPWMNNYNYRKAFDKAKYEQWTNDTGLQMRERQTRMVEQWKEVKARREKWWNERKGEKFGEKEQLAVVGTEVVTHLDVEEQMKCLGDVEQLDAGDDPAE